VKVLMSFEQVNNVVLHRVPYFAVAESPVRLRSAE
jgi:hypothetical protein